MNFGTRRTAPLLLIALVLFFAACSGGGGGNSDPLPGPQAGLLRFTDCGELSSYLQETRIAEAKLLGSYGMFWSGAEDLMAPEMATGAQAGDGAGRDYTSTNVQEAGVDEADFVKSDGDHLYLVSGGYLMVFGAWPADQTRELSRTELEGNPFALFVEEGIAVVLSRVWDMSGVEEAFAPQTWEVVKLSLFDLADRSEPVLLREAYLEGSFADARLVDGRLHLVLTSGVNGYGATDAALPVPLGVSAPEVSFPTWLDRVYGAEPRVELLCACENVYRPAGESGTGFLTLLTLDLADPLGRMKSVSVLGDSGMVYASADSLYVVAANNDIWLWGPVAEGTAQRPRATSTLHKFSLGADPAYAGSGEVDGWALNAFSLSEHEGVLRVATSEPAWVTGSGPANRVLLLEQVEDRLEEKGRIEGLGKPGESIFAVRFAGEMGFVVTYERTDPLYALDLSVPADPKVSGELEVPGFSTYLHPLDQGRLLAVGRDPDLGSVKLSLFDVSDPAAPREVGSLSVAKGSYSEAEYDHHAFGYFPKERVLALPVTAWGAGDGPESCGGYTVFSGLYLYDVDPKTGFSPRGRVDHAEFYRNDEQEAWYAPESVSRSCFIGEEGAGDYLYSVSRRGLKVTDLEDLEKDVAALELPAEDLWWMLPVMDAQ